VAAVRDGTLAPVPLAVLVLTALAAFEIVAPLPGAAARLGAVRAAGARLFDVLDTPPALSPRQAALPAPAGSGLRIRGLRVRYGPGEPWALDGVDLDIPPGRRVAVVGPSGSGKSTLAAVLFRFRDPDAGTVHLDGIDVTAVPADTVRVLLTGMPQDPHVFASTVRENLRLARPDATDAELRAVLGRVGLDPALLDTDVGVHGTRLSGGMRQRLAIARALLVPATGLPATGGSPLLVLDEPTTHLDPDTRDAVLDDMLSATAGRSLILITHDLDALDRMDDVVVLVEGRVQQRGPAAELRRRPGWYRDAASPGGARRRVSPAPASR
jgi:ATP-binding cassette subfamily C protein CydC